MDWHKNDDLPPLPIPYKSYANAVPHDSTENRPTRSRERATSAGRGTARSATIYEEREAKLKQLLYTATQQLQAEKQRADEAERRAREVATRLRSANDARLTALQDVARVNEELKLYKIQLETAQQEIFRAQDVLSVVDAQRVEAEEDAARARAATRKMNQEVMVQLAREEGRRTGIREGIERGRDLGFYEGHMMGYSQAYSSDFDFVDEDEVYSDDYQRASRRTSQGTSRRTSRRASEDHHVHNSRYTSTDENHPPSPPVPVPPPCSTTKPADENRPTIVRSVPPSPRHPPITIPPDGFIPEAGLDSIIHLPPPHELVRSPTMPGQSPPSISYVVDEPLMIPANAVPRPHKTRSRRYSSPESNSTTLSQLDMVNEPTGARTPLSAIPEVLSLNTSPNPQSIGSDQGLQHQRSWGGGSTYQQHVSGMATPRSGSGDIGGTGQQPRQQGLYTRPRSPSNSSSSSRRPTTTRSLKQDRRASLASVSTVPDINILPPSNTSQDSIPVRPMGDRLSPADADRPVASPRDPTPSSAGHATPMALPEGQLPAGFMPTGFTPAPAKGESLPHLGYHDQDHPTNSVPGGYHDTFLRTPESQSHEPPVIPDRALYGPDSDEDALSSGMSSADTLTTPPTRRTYLANPSYTGNTRYTAAGVALPSSTVAGTPRSGYPNPNYTGATHYTGADYALPPSTSADTPRIPANPNYTGATHYTAARHALPPSTVADTPRINPSYTGTTHITGVGVALPPSTVAGTPRAPSANPNYTGAGATHLTGVGVPLPPSTVAGTPRPPTNANYTGSTLITSAGVPLPPSTVAGTPRSKASGGKNGYRK